MNYLLTMAHGAEHFRQEAVYLLLTWLRQRRPEASGHCFLVATDRPASFTAVLGERSDIRYLPLDADTLLHWQGGPGGYVHRIKPQLIAHAAGVVGAGPADTFTFLDSDTAFLADPAPLFETVAAGRPVLHLCEGTIEGSRRLTRSHGRLHRMAQHSLFDVGGRAGQPLGLDLPLWNSGVIGLRGHEVAPVMAETLALTDQIRARLSLATAEQVALSAVLRARGRPVEAAAGWLLHYHGFKEFRADIAGFLAHHAAADTAPDWVALSTQIDPQVRMAPKTVFMRLPKWQRQLRKHLGHGWRRLPYPWEA